MLMLEGITRLRCLRVRGVKDIRVLILVVVALRRSFDDSRLSKSRGVQDTFCSFAVPIIANQLCRRPTSRLRKKGKAYRRVGWSVK